MSQRLRNGQAHDRLSKEVVFGLLPPLATFTHFHSNHLSPKSQVALAFPLGSINERDCMYNTESRHMREETREGDEFIQLFSLITSAVTAQLVGFH